MHFMIEKGIENNDEFEQLWRKAIRSYDSFFMNLRPYRELLDIHVSNLRDCNKILDTGAGAGRVSEELLRDGKEVVAIDKNSYGLDLLRERTSEYGDRLRIKAIDAHLLPFESNSFDGVNSMLVLLFMRNPKLYLRECARVLKKDGIMVLSGPSRAAKDIDFVGNGWIKQLEEDGLMERVQSDWKTVFESTNTNIKDYAYNWFEKDELVNVLEEEVGLKIDVCQDNPLYYGRGYVMVARKTSE